jgi:hypothetical protein
MLMHIVLFTFKTPWNWLSLEAIEAEKSSRKHPNYINEIKGWTCGRNTTKRDISADFVVIGLFENRKDFNIYMGHPDHQIGVNKWKSIADWKVIDIDLLSDFTLNRGLLYVLNNLSNI